MAKKVFTDESLETFVDEIKTYTDEAVSKKADSSHNHDASNITTGTLSSDRLPTVPVSSGGTGATTAAGALTNLGITATATELNYMDGVTSNVQSQLDGKALDGHTHAVTDIDNLTASVTELNYVDGVTSNIQTQLNNKASAEHKHTVSEITDLTATVTELNYMDGVTSNVQGQLDNKAASGHGHDAASSTAAGFMSAADKTKLDGITASADSVAFSQSLTSGTKVGTITINGTDTSLYAPTNTDTKNTAGSIDSSEKLFLVGATFQGANPETYSQDTAYVGTDGCLYSGSEKVLTAHPTVDVGDDTTDTASPTHSGTFTTVDDITRDENGHVLEINTTTVTLPAQYTHPEYTAITGAPTANQTPAFGGTFTVTQPISDETGHITAMNSRTVTIPSATATSSAAGLMSAADKAKLDTVAENANNYTHPNSGVTAGTYSNVTVNAAGHVTAGSNASAGDASTPVYFSNGSPVACTSLDLNTTGSSASCTGNAATATALTTSAGDANTPVYFSSGKPVACTSLDLNTSGSAATLTTARNINGMSFNGSAAINNYGVCGTAAATAAKTVTVGSTFTLETGAQVVVKFTYANSVASPTLNVNSTGAKPIYRYGTTAASTSTTVNGWVAGAVQRFTYDGTGWIMDYWYNTTYYNSNVTCATAAATAAKVGSTSYYTLANNKYFICMMAYANSYAGAITLNVASKGAKPIYINGSASSSSNYTLPAGIYLVYYDGTNYYFRTDGTMTASITGSAAKLGTSTVGGTGTPIYLNAGTATAVTSVGVAKGGTGKTSWTANRLIYPSASTTMAQLAFPTTAGSVLRQGTSGAPYWTSLTDLATAMGISGSAKIATGSYTGTGTYGSSNPCSLTFDFVPHTLVLYTGNTSFTSYSNGCNQNNIAILIKDSNSCTISASCARYTDAALEYYDSSGTSVATLNFVVSGNTAKWYVDNPFYYYYNAYYQYYCVPTASMQFNVSSTVYSYIAIG